jgi:ABC-2 type transport system ATP-binding protein
MAVSADQIIVIGRGKFITSGTVDDLTANAAGTVLVRSSDPSRLTQVLNEAHGVVEPVNDAGLSVAGLTSDQVGEAAFAAGIVVHELTPQRASLEDVFMDLTADSLEYGHRSEKVQP